MRLIDADALDNKMYYEAFENDASYNESNPMAKWDSGLWIRYKMFENAIDDAPTIEPKRGEWIEFDTKWGRSFYYCTNCMETSEVPTAFGKPLYNFCPNCGADMRERKDERDYL